MNKPQQAVVETVLEAMKKAETDWIKRKKTREWFGSHSNAVNGSSYRWINALITSDKAVDKGYEQTWRVTYNQTKQIWWNVKQGEKSTTILFSSPIIDKDLKDTPDEDDEKRRMTKLYHIFNLEQVKDIDETKLKIKQVFNNNNDPVAELEAIAEKYMLRDWVELIPSIDWRCFYRPSSHSVHMVDIKQFDRTASYYEALFHEIVHSTALSLKRKVEGQTNKFGSHDYSIEEMVAEFGSTMILAGKIDMDLQNRGAYIAHRAKHIEQEKRQQELYIALQQWQKASDYIQDLDYKK